VGSGGPGLGNNEYSWLVFGVVGGGWEKEEIMNICCLALASGSFNDLRGWLAWNWLGFGLGDRKAGLLGMRNSSWAWFRCCR